MVFHAVARRFFKRCSSFFMPTGVAIFARFDSTFIQHVFLLLFQSERLIISRFSGRCPELSAFALAGRVRRVPCGKGVALLAEAAGVFANSASAIELAPRNGKTFVGCR